MTAQSSCIEINTSSRCSSIFRVGSALLISLGTLVGITQPGLAISENELYKLCSKYPHNTQCEGYSIPIPLSRRAGEEGVCALNTQEMSLADICKVLVEEERLTVYVEQGEAIAPLDNERGTEEFSLELSHIDGLSYREEESINSGRLVANTLLFGVWGAMFTRPDKISQLEVQFADMAATPVDVVVPIEPMDSMTLSNESPVAITTADEADIDAADSVEAIVEPAEPVPNGNLIFETDRKKGRSLTEGLQQLTGIPLRTSL